MSENLTELRPDDFRFCCESAVRFRDVDAMNHVNNAVYLTYFEIARDGYARALGHCEADASPAERFPFILLDVYCRYVSAAEPGERLLIHLRTSRMGGKSFEFEYLITSAGDRRTVAVGRSTQVYYDYASGRTEPIPEHFRQLVAAIEEQSSG